MNILPNSQQAERSLLSALLVDEESFYNAIQVLTVDHFYHGTNRAVYGAMVKNESNSIPMLINKLSNEDGIEDYVCDLLADYGGTNIREIIPILQDKYQKRKICIASHKAISEAMGDPDSLACDIANQLQQSIYDATEGKESNKPIKMCNLLPEVFKHTEALQTGQKQGILSGIEKLDKQVCGFHPGELIILAGRPAMGKSSFADSILRHCAINQGLSVAVFSLEMSKLLCSTRMLFAQSGVSYHQAKTGMLPKRELPKLDGGAEPLSQSNIWIDDTPDLTYMDMITKCNYIKSQTGIDLIVLDYLQLMEGTVKGASRQEAVSKISRDMKKLAKMFDVPLIALSQLSRAVEMRSPPRPQMSDLRESGAIEQDADVILMLYRDEVYNSETKEPNVAEIIIGKQRNGPVGIVKAFFDGDNMRFLNLQENTTTGGHYADNF